MTLFDLLDKNMDAVMAMGDHAIAAAKRAGIPAHYVDPSLGPGIIRELLARKTGATRRAAGRRREVRTEDLILVGTTPDLHDPRRPKRIGEINSLRCARTIGSFLNADRAAKLINPANPEAASFAAGRRTLRELASAIRERRDFVYETTLSSNQPLDLMLKAKRAGYAVGVVFVVLSNVDLNVERVAQRVAGGGHDISEPIIRRRHGRAIARFGQAIPLADEIVILDNTADTPKVILRMSDRTIREDHFDRTEAVHALLWKIVASAIGD